MQVIPGVALLGGFLAGIPVWAMFQRRWQTVLCGGGARPLDTSHASMVFRNGFLVDASPALTRSLGLDPLRPVGWAEMANLFNWRFPDFPARPPKTSVTVFAKGDDAAQMDMIVSDKAVRLTLADGQVPVGDGHANLRSHRDLEPLRAAMLSAPNPIWRQGPSGNVLWANPAYYDLCTSLGHVDPGTLPRGVEGLADAPPGETLRCRLIGEQNDAPGHWFEVTATDYAGETVCFANDISAQVQSEAAQRNFVQTLAKTFAHLPIGLAIFDRKRQLALFNPALIDLTQLSAEFLSARPSLFSFFDRLRETRMMPEPKDYTHWRQDMVDLVRAATDDRYCETWSMPSGLTYKVTGRPHPDGAIAFLIEDISAEISLTRRFRAELDQSQSALDALDDAIAIFSQIGVMLMCNQQFSSLWDCDPDQSLQDMTVIDISRKWQLLSAPNPAWSDLRDFIQASTDRAPWESEVMHRRDGALRLRVSPIKGGNTMVRFERIAQAAEPQVEQAREVAL